MRVFTLGPGVQEPKTTSGILASRIGGEGDAKSTVGVQKGILGQHWEGGGGLWLHEQCKTR